MSRKAKRLAIALVAALGGALLLAGIASASTGPGSELDYAQTTSDVTLSTSGPTLLVGGAAVTYDGSTRIRVTFSAAVAECNGGDGTIQFRLYDGGTVLRTIGYLGFVGGHAQDTGVTAVTELTPSAGPHTYSVYAALGGSCNSSSQIYGSTGTGGAYGPMFMSITQMTGSWASGGSSTLAGLSDVNITSPSNNDVLTYNASSSKWTNQPDTDSSSSGGAAAVCGGPGLPACMVDTTSGSGLDTSLNYIWWGIALLCGIVTFGLLVRPHWDRLFNWWGNPA